jgi:tetratricopeptide (TPR) repeat protein
LKLSFGGNFALRNDNPSNIVFGTADEDLADCEQLNKKGEEFYKFSELQLALRSYQAALEQAGDEEKECLILSNIAKCLNKQSLYEDAIEYCDQAFKIDPDHKQCLF